LQREQERILTLFPLLQRISVDYKPHRLMQINADSEPKKRATIALEKKPKLLAKTDLAYWRRRLRKQPNSANWFVEISARGVRRKLSMETPNKENAAVRAREIYQLARSVGWEAVLQKYRPKNFETKTNLTVGQFIALAESVAGVKKRTLRGYIGALRKIVSDSFGLDAGNKKFDPHSGGNRKWLERVHAVRLAILTPRKVQDWKRSFLLRAGQDPVSQRSAKVSVNTFLRQARSLFSPKILRHFKDVSLPDPLPFSGLEFEPRPSLKYRATFDVRALIGKAKDELAPQNPEAFKAFLLAALTGLRRKEIDLLEWDSFLWEIGVVRVQATQHFDAKTEDSLGDVAVDEELLEVFRGYRARATGSFVIESAGQPKFASYSHYRCQDVFDDLITWLRQNGVGGNKPLHTLRKEFGSQICAAHGVHAASRQLRHADIAITNMFYTDVRRRALTGLGHLLKADENVLSIIEEPARTYVRTIEAFER
jgi:integrase